MLGAVGSWARKGVSSFELLGVQGACEGCLCDSFGHGKVLGILQRWSSVSVSTCKGARRARVLGNKLCNGI